MYRRPSKKKQLAYRIALYTGMTLLVITIVAGLIFVILGYRFDTENGRVEQGSLLQFATIPSGATVTIDGKAMSSKTPTKSSVLAGNHTFKMERAGYETWQKSLDVTAGTLTWLDYARLVPKNRPIQAVATYAKLHSTLASEDGQTIIVQEDPAVPSFTIVDLRSNEITSSTITLPVEVYSDSQVPGTAHAFTVNSWDKGGRYVLVQHTYADKQEWLVVDTRDVVASKNASTILGIDIVSPVFSGTSGNVLYALSATSLRKLDLSAGTISRSLASNVTSFELFETNIITYVGTSAVPNQRVLGLYRDGDESPHVIRTISDDISIPIHISTARYFNDNYIALTIGSQVTILNGDYPASSANAISSMSTYGTFTVGKNIDYIGFSPSGDYLLVQSGSAFTTYDIERKRVSVSNIVGSGTTVTPLRWLDDDHVWYDNNGMVVMREFDGANMVNINTSVVGQDVTLTNNDRYLYSVGKTQTGYQLQRVRMVLP